MTCVARKLKDKAHVLEDYYTRVFLRGDSPSRISCVLMLAENDIVLTIPSAFRWMGSAQLAIPFAVGIIVGKLFDAGHIRSVMIFGSVLFTLWYVHAIHLTRSNEKTTLSACSCYRWLMKANIIRYYT